MPSDLIARLGAATEPSRELDEEIAIAIGMWKHWLSKHRYWNFDGPDDAKFHWPTNGLPKFNPDTGKRIELSETPPSGWAQDADLPEWTASLDAAMTLVPEGYLWELKQGFEATAMVWSVMIDYDEQHPAPFGASLRPALALCIAALRARGVGGV